MLQVVLSRSQGSQDLLDPRVLPACGQRSFWQRCSTRPQAVAEHHFPLAPVSKFTWKHQSSKAHRDSECLYRIEHRGRLWVTHAARWPVPDPRVDKCLPQRIPESHGHGPRREAERKPSPGGCGSLGRYMLYSMANIERKVA